MEKKSTKQEGGRGKNGVKRDGVQRSFVIIFIIFSFAFFFFSDLRKSDRRFSSGLKVKLIYATRATRGHQKVGVSTNSMR